MIYKSFDLIISVNLLLYRCYLTGVTQYYSVSERPRYMITVLFNNNTLTITTSSDLSKLVIDDLFKLTKLNEVVYPVVRGKYNPTLKNLSLHTYKVDRTLLSEYLINKDDDILIPDYIKDECDIYLMRYSDVITRLEKYMRDVIMPKYIMRKYTYYELEK